MRKIHARSKCEQQKLDDLQNVAKSLDPCNFYVCSNEGNLNNVEEFVPKQQSRKRRAKPEGLWYATGNNWIDYLFFNRGWYNDWSTEWLLSYTHIYQIGVKRTSVLKLYSPKEIRQFSQIYGLPAKKDHRKEQKGRPLDSYKDKNLIDWNQVSKNHGGIEIDYNYTLESQILWYDGWSCTSGCIWGKEMLEYVELIWHG